MFMDVLKILKMLIFRMEHPLCESECFFFVFIFPGGGTEGGLLKKLPAFGLFGGDRSCDPGRLCFLVQVVKKIGCCIIYLYHHYSRMLLFYMFLYFF